MTNTSTNIKRPHHLSPIGLGAMPLSLVNRPTETQAIDVIHQFIAMGGNFIDTANVYGFDESDKGHNERLIQRALKTLHQTDHVLVATKGGATRPNNGWSFKGGGHPKSLRAACEQSLVNLQRNEHGLYYLHGPDIDIPLEDSLGELIRLKDEGKIKQLGVANFTLDQLSMTTNLTSLFAVQNRCNPFCKGDITSGVMNYCKTNNIYYIPYCPLGGSFDHAKLNQSPLFINLAAKYQVSSYSLCLAWLLHKGDYVIPIPGMNTLAQLEENFKATTLSIEANDLEAMNQFPDLYLPQHFD